MKRVILVFILLNLHYIGYCQTKTDIKDKKYLFGINLSIHQSFLSITGEIPNNAKIENVPGFSFGMISEYLFTKRLSILPKIEVSFNDSKVLLEKENGDFFKYQILPLSLDFMAHLHYKFSNKKISPYILLGPNFKKTIAGNDNDDRAWSSKSNFSIDIGIGIEKYFKYLIGAPELVYSYGLVDINSNSNFEAINHHTLSLAFNFKG